MARFQLPRDVNFHWQGHDFVGAAGTVFWLTLTEAEMPAHFHDEMGPTGASGGTIGIANDTNATGSADSGLNTGSAGSGQPHNNLQPYLVVRFWQRTA